MRKFDRAIECLQQGVASKEEILKLFLQTRVYCIANSISGEQETAKDEFRMLHVADSDDSDQPMLAIFTSRAKATEFMNGASEEFQHVIRGEGGSILLMVNKGIGLRINPDSNIGFRLSANSTAEVKEKLASHIKEIATSMQANH